MRLDKALADMGAGTRNEIRKACRANRIAVNGVLIRDPSIHIDPEQDEIEIDGEPFLYQKYVYYMLNKPAGVISAGRQTSLRSIFIPERIFVQSESLIESRTVTRYSFSTWCFGERRR